MQQLDLFEPDDVTLRSVDPEANRFRFYRMAVSRDLFGDWVLVRQWGRFGTWGRQALEPFPSEGAARVAMALVMRAKRRRGYGERS